MPFRKQEWPIPSREDLYGNPPVSPTSAFPISRPTFDSEKEYGPSPYREQDIAIVSFGVGVLIGIAYVIVKGFRR